MCVLMSKCLMSVCSGDLNKHTELYECSDDEALEDIPIDHFMCTTNSSYSFGESILARTLLQKEPDDVMIEIDPSAADVKIWDYQCSQCGNTFAQKRYLAFHLKNTCQKDPRFFCALCTAKYKKKYDLEAHILHKHMNNK